LILFIAHDAIYSADIRCLMLKVMDRFGRVQLWFQEKMWMPWAKTSFTFTLLMERLHSFNYLNVN